MPIEAQEIEDLIRESFPDAKVTVTDLAGDGNHYAAEVIDESFRGQNRVQQQRAVYAALKDKMSGSNGALHALALTTKVPPE
ncbi:BolA family transcriptional regulator [Mesobaculum littorinae]|uniref:BolA family transcriptional regulator n=1 Tax=Mesobaculum littorinae TaxID=2486419 RepID=A0A438AKW7_9RHOB|nr:BolA family transcriptional regulator [Mesobaculum littorinae]RVV99255.1 BolA family transcriptional regulator [Mesobaculum littorinae]